MDDFQNAQPWPSSFLPLQLLVLLTRSSATIQGGRGINGRTRMDGPTEGPPIPHSLRLFGRSLFEIDELVP